MQKNRADRKRNQLPKPNQTRFPVAGVEGCWVTLQAGVDLSSCVLMAEQSLVLNNPDCFTISPTSGLRWILSVMVPKSICVLIIYIIFSN